MEARSWFHLSLCDLINVSYPFSWDKATLNIWSTPAQMRDLDVTALKGGVISPYEDIKSCGHKIRRLIETLYLTHFMSFKWIILTDHMHINMLISFILIFI